MKNAKKYLLAGIAVLLVTALIGLGVLYRVDKWVQDWLYQQPSVSSSDIIIFGIDEDALDILGPSQPSTSCTPVIQHRKRMNGWPVPRKNSATWSLPASPSSGMLSLGTTGMPYP